MAEVVLAFLWGEGAEEYPRAENGAHSGLAQQRFEFCEGHFDGIEVGGIGRQIEQAGSCRLDGLAYAALFAGR